MNTIEVRELMHFTTVADALHFGAAAEALGISQPPLSRSIARLERRLGFPLFHRTTRRISLTPAGEVFLADCRRLLADMDGAIRRAQRVGKSSSLTLAVRPGAGQSVLTGLLCSYAERPGSGPVEILYCYDEVSALHTGVADVALMCASSTINGLELLALGDERPVAALPAGHRLAARSSLTMAELHSLPEFSDTLPNEPLDAIVDRVARDLLVVVVGEGVADRLGAAVTAVPVVDYPITHLVLAWPADQAHAPRAELVRMAQRLTRPARLAPVL
ncbi:MAG TPA: LysR family transcriptional regulator [Jatrophihabitantaceae bacterium]|jgi:DNA-binding transcriptional LysR family regulator